jgi:large subunit ribosomal protein L17
MRKGRHTVKKLGRTAEHRHATMANMATQMFLHKRIITTEAKAKAIRPYVEALITKAKAGTQHAQREAFKTIKDKEAMKQLFGDIASKVATRNGGYTRIVKMPPRFGDAAKMALIELVDFSDASTEPRAKKQDRAKRVRGSKDSQVKGDDQKEATATA